MAMSKQEQESLALLRELLAKAETREQKDEAFRLAVSEFPWDDKGDWPDPTDAMLTTKKVGQPSNGT